MSECRSGEKSGRVKNEFTLKRFLSILQGKPTAENKQVDDKQKTSGGGKSGAMS
jgi:hypothetical protein